MSKGEMRKGAARAFYASVSPLISPTHTFSNLVQRSCKLGDLMKNALLYAMGALLISVAVVAGYYSIAQSISYIDVNLGASKTWYIIAVMAVVVEVVGLPIIREMCRIKTAFAFITAALMIPLLSVAIGVSLYLEGGKATQVLSDARASRSIDATLADGHKESLKQLLATQKKYIDSRRVSKQRVAEINQKIKEQATWAKQTAVSEINPMISMISKATNASDKTIEMSFVALVVLFPLLVKMLFGHAGLMFLTSPYREEKKEPEKVPAPTPQPVQEVTPEPSPKGTPEPVEEGEPEYSRLGSKFTRKDNVIKLERRPKSRKQRKKKDSEYHDNQVMVREFLEGCDTQIFEPREGWTLFKQQYPHTMRENQFYSALKALANRKEIDRKKVNGRTKYRLKEAA